MTPLMKLAQDLENKLPDEFKTVITKNTILAEQQFKKELNEKNKFLGSGRQLIHMHTTWGPNAKNMSVEELVKHLWEVENAPKTQILPGELDL